MIPLRGVFLAGLASLALSGPAGVVLAGATALLLATQGRWIPDRAWVPLHGLCLLVAIGVALVGFPVPGFALLVSWLLVHRRWTGKSPGDTRVALLLATLLLLLGATSTESAVMAPIFLLYSVLLPVALLRAELVTVEEAPRRLELGVAVTTVVITACLFAVLPRLDMGYLGRARGNASFPSTVGLGDEALLNDDASEVLRAKVTDADGRRVALPIYFRGRAHDHFDGARWTTRATRDQPPTGAWDVRADLEVTGVSGDVLFAVPDVIRVEGTSAERRAGGVFLARTPGRTARYTTFGRQIPLADIAAADVEPWLQLPDTIDPRVRPLAWTIAAEDADPVTVARALTAWLQTNKGYVEVPPAPTGDPVGWFLFDAEGGHCEYFASALVMLLRQRGIPARLATGFVASERDGDEVVVRRGNAHAWVEVRTAAGWATLDPTPASDLPTVDVSGLDTRLRLFAQGWYARVVEYDMEAQFDAYGVVGRRLLLGGAAGQSPLRAGFVGMIAVVGALGAALIGARVLLNRIGAPPRRRDPMVRLAAKARRVIRRRGWALPDDLPLLEAADWLEARVGAEAAPLRRLGELVYAARFGGGRFDLGSARACVRQLARVPKAGSELARGPIE